MLYGCYKFFFLHNISSLILLQKQQTWFSIFSMQCINFSTMWLIFHRLFIAQQAFSTLSTKQVCWNVSKGKNAQTNDIIGRPWYHHDKCYHLKEMGFIRQWCILPNTFLIMDCTECEIERYLFLFLFLLFLFPFTIIMLFLIGKQTQQIRHVV